MLILKKKKGRKDDGCNNIEKQFEINPYKFFKIILPHILHHKTLRIPETFARDLRPQFPTLATLTIQTGLSWKIELERIEKKLYFTQGWADFMEQNAIKYGYFLEFEYQGNEHFKVDIFNLSCAEIEYPIEYYQYAKHRDHDDKVKDVVMVEDEAEKDCIILGSNNISPSFTAVVQNYNISSAYSYLHIPKSFSDKYMKGNLYKSVMLQTGDGREWYVSCYVYRDVFNLVGIIWKKFVKENQWDEHQGEKYTFVLVDKKRYSVTFKVIKE